MKEQLPPVASAIVTNERAEVLVVERTKQDIAEDGSVLKCSFPGGGVEPDETVLQGVVRETLEETGYLVEPTEVLFAGRHPLFPIHMTYVACKLIAHLNPDTQDSGVKNVLWVPIADLPTTFTTPIHEAIAEHLGLNELHLPK